MLLGATSCYAAPDLASSEILHLIRRGVRANLVPGLVLQLFALTFVGAYYLSPDFAAGLDRVGAWKETWGYAFSVPSTALFGGAIPFLVLWVSKLVPPGEALRQLLFYVGFWCWKGAEVDAFYRAQAWLFGSEATLLVVVEKVFVDQFIYNPLWAAPTQAICFLWKDSGFSRTELRRRLRVRPLAWRVVVVLVSTWVVWVPAVCIVYSLPSPLQLPLFNLVLCFWCLLLSFVSRQGDAA